MHDDRSFESYSNVAVYVFDTHLFRISLVFFDICPYFSSTSAQAWFPWPGQTAVCRSRRCRSFWRCWAICQWINHPHSRYRYEQGSFIDGQRIELRSVTENELKIRCSKQEGFEQDFVSKKNKPVSVCFVLPYNLSEKTMSPSFHLIFQSQVSSKPTVYN